MERLQGRERADKRASPTRKKQKQKEASSDGGEPSGATCLLIRPLDGAATASAAQVAASVEPFVALGFPLASEALEKDALRTSLGWLDPRGLLGYSARSTYKDLYVYFDAADEASPENALATKAFKMYGLDGVQGGCNWERIRGNAIVVRIEPPVVAGGFTDFVMGLSSKTPPVKLDEPHNPIMTVEEMTETLLFFRDHDRSAQHIAQTRDSQRMFNNPTNPVTAHMPPPSPGCVGLNFGPTGRVREDSKVVGKDAESCAGCGIKAATIGRALKRCKRCMQVRYCSRECQRRDWKVHKEVCAPVAK